MLGIHILLLPVTGAGISKGKGSSIPWGSKMSSWDKEMQGLASGSQADVHPSGRDENRYVPGSICHISLPELLSRINCLFSPASSRIYLAVHVITCITETHRPLILCRDTASSPQRAGTFLPHFPSVEESVVSIT